MFWWCCLVAKWFLTLAIQWIVAPPGSTGHGISQARMLEWVAISFLRDSSQPRDQTCVSCIGERILYQLCHLGSPWIFSAEGEKCLCK